MKSLCVRTAVSSSWSTDALEATRKYLTGKITNVGESCHATQQVWHAGEGADLSRLQPN